MPEKIQMTSPIPKPERCPKPRRACSRSRRFPPMPARRSRRHDQRPRDQPRAVRVPSWSGCRIASGRRDPKEELMPRITGKPSASPTRAIPWPNNTAPMPQANPRGQPWPAPPRKLAETRLPGGNRGRRDNPGKKQQARDSVHQPDILPAPTGEPLHGGGEAAIQQASQQSQREAPANLMSHKSPRGFRMCAREARPGQVVHSQPATPSEDPPSAPIENQDVARAPAHSGRCSNDLTASETLSKTSNIVTSLVILSCSLKPFGQVGQFQARALVLRGGESRHQRAQPGAINVGTSARSRTRRVLPWLRAP